MQDADALGDKIIIMAKGKIVCAGTSDFLKKRFGTGFLLTITMTSNVQNIEANATRILEQIQTHIPQAMFDGAPAIQFTVILPYESKTK